MKKIMFNDKYGLTKAVLAGRKTMTRRIVTPKVAKLIEQCAKPTLIIPLECIPAGFSIEEFVEQINKGDLPILYRSKSKERIRVIDSRPDVIKYSTYKIGEEIAVAQSYRDSITEGLVFDNISLGLFSEKHCLYKEAGWKNKMFVKAELMPHRILIKDIKVEHLQDISDEECLQEGITPFGYASYTFDNWVSKRDKSELCCDTPRNAFSHLIDMISGKGIWDSNPWVFAYTFKLIR